MFLFCWTNICFCFVILHSSKEHGRFLSMILWSLRGPTSGPKARLSSAAQVGDIHNVVETKTHNQDGEEHMGLH